MAYQNKLSNYNTPSYATMMTKILLSVKTLYR
jgi:hypothetical protein